jgi:hypothetical protein
MTETFRDPHIGHFSRASKLVSGNYWDEPAATLPMAQQLNFLPFMALYGAHENVPRATKATPAQARQIYTNGFATALASHSPEEDYVETYKLSAIPSNQIGPLIIHLPDLELTINAYRADLASKLAAGPPCF